MPASRRPQIKNRIKDLIIEHLKRELFEARTFKARNAGIRALILVKYKL
jgi:hypothetical protein